MGCKSGGMSIKRQRTGKEIEPKGVEHMRMEPTGIEHIRIEHIIRSKAAGKRTKPKRLCRRIKHIRKGKMVVRIRIIYESIEHGSAE